jgi:hypothetical protein
MLKMNFVTILHESRTYVAGPIVVEGRGQNEVKPKDNRIQRLCVGLMTKG